MWQCAIHQNFVFSFVLLFSVIDHYVLRIYTMQYRLRSYLNRKTWTVTYQNMKKYLEMMRYGNSYIEIVPQLIAYRIFCPANV